MGWLRRKNRVRLVRKEPKATPSDPTESLVMALRSSSATAEAYRTLRTNLLHAGGTNPPTVGVLTSLGQGDGKSATCANLGVALAQARRNTLIIDGDLRKPMLHRYFGLPNLWGMADVLAGDRSLSEAWVESHAGLKVLPAGSSPPDPTEL